MDDSLSREYESTLTRAERRRGGVFNTPLAVARSVCESVIDRVGTVCDPSCGTGTFLVAAVERLTALGASPSTAASLVVGVEIDSGALAVARSRLPAGVRLVQGDGLVFDEPVDFVVGNPPFVDGLAARFLAASCRRARVGVGMIAPASVLATDEGAAFRASGVGVVSVDRLAADVFPAAAVDACALALRWDAPVPAGPTWASLLVDGSVPDVALDDDAPALGESCDVVAGFRQHYYGLRGCVSEGSSGPLLVTSGSIGLGTMTPGGRFDGVRYSSPRVAVDAIASPAVRSWYSALLRPKVVVATQTRVLEAAVDDVGAWVPSVPVISVLPADPSRVWSVLAVLLAPPVTAWALRRWGGTALSPSALKLGAPAVRSIPVPSSRPASAASWSTAASKMQAGDVVGGARAMCTAYGVGEEVHEWWLDRAGLAR